MLKAFKKFAAAAALSIVAAGPALAQPDAVDPNQPVQYEEAPADPQQVSPPASEWTPIDESAAAAPAEPAPGIDVGVEASTTVAPPATTTAAPQRSSVPRGDVFSAAENLFGRGAEGLGGLLERILSEQGEPVAYISGQEASGAFVLGVRYGSGTMRHQVEGDRAVYWTGPSLGFDFGADASKVFVLVYNLHDGQDLFKRYPNAEGHAYMVGGFSASYLRRGNVVLIPVRLGVGVRLGINGGYMRFSERNRWLPF